MTQEITIEPIPLLKDNYAWLIHAGKQTPAAIVDPAEAAPVRAALEQRGLTLGLIVNTHHHGDHTGGNRDLKRLYGCRIAGPQAEADRIPGIDSGLREGDTLLVGPATAQILETPGHTAGHICLHLPAARALFCGDTLFAMGCGRLFEGTAEQMWASLQKIMTLPDDTLICCGHEYTLANGLFCMEEEPENRALQNRMEDIRTLRAQNRPTLPCTLALEKETNVFLRAGSAERFAALRRRKDAA